MIDLHYWPTPNGKKITILLEECGLPYRIVPCRIGQGDQRALRRRFAASVHVHMRVDHAGKNSRRTQIQHAGLARDLHRAANIGNSITPNEHDLVVEEISGFRIKQFAGSDCNDLRRWSDEFTFLRPQRRRLQCRHCDECDDQLDWQTHRFSFQGLSPCPPRQNHIPRLGPSANISVS